MSSSTSSVTSSSSSNSSESSSSSGLLKFAIGDPPENGEGHENQDDAVVNKIVKKRAPPPPPAPVARKRAAPFEAPMAKRNTIENILQGISVPAPPPTPESAQEETEAEARPPSSVTSSCAPSSLSVFAPMMDSLQSQTRTEPEPVISSQRRKSGLVITQTPPEGVSFWSWLRVPQRALEMGRFANSYAPEEDPRRGLRPRCFLPHRTMLENFSKQQQTSYAAVLTVATKAVCRIAAVRYLMRIKVSILSTVASAVCIVSDSLVRPPPPVTFPDAEKSEELAKLEPINNPPKNPPPAPPIPIMEKYKVNIRMEYWVGAKHTPPWMTKDHFKAFFSTPEREVLDVRFFYNISVSGEGELLKLPYAAVRFSSAAHVVACLNQLWVVDGNCLLDLVDCCGGLFGKFINQVNVSLRL
eukprot:TRINITY_DN17111_c0_g1_i1.p1 TRINITY_DN17111_c0_g1~~TRINITY_DN17111_c0_g1_i1.p1  ORF type:complete len:413 (+),score=70.99 TRINITY_DN17111_c0_g1_i1:82-1320(+)